MVLPQVGAWVPNSCKYSRTVQVTRLVTVNSLHVTCYCEYATCVLFLWISNKCLVTDYGACVITFCYMCLICFQCLRYSARWLVLLHTGYLVLICLVLPNLRSASSINSMYFRLPFEHFSLLSMWNCLWSKRVYLWHRQGPREVWRTVRRDSRAYGGSGGHCCVLFGVVLAQQQGPGESRGEWSEIRLGAGHCVGTGESCTRI